MIKQYKLAGIATELLRDQHRAVPLGAKAGFELTNGRHTYYVITDRDPLLPLYHVSLFVHFLHGSRVLCLKVLGFTVDEAELQSTSRVL